MKGAVPTLALLLAGAVLTAGCMGGGSVDAMERQRDAGPGPGYEDDGGGDGDGGGGAAYDQLDRARAQAKFPDTTALMRYVIAPGCAAELNECHYNEDFPDMSSEGNLLNLLNLPCNLQIGERTGVEDFCEAVGDELRISAGANAGFVGRVGSIKAVTSAAGAFQAWEVRLERAPTAAQSNASFQLLRGGTALPALGSGSSLQVSAGLYGPWTVNKNVAGLAGGDRDADVVGAVLRTRLFVFLRRRAPLGPWLSPFVQGGLVRATVAGETQSGNALAGGLAVGWTFRVARRWLLALGAGAQLHRVSVDGSTDDPGFARLGPHVDINVNYTF